MLSEIDLKIWPWNLILVRVHIAEHPRQCFENEDYLLEEDFWNEGKGRNMMAWDPRLLNCPCYSTHSFNQRVCKRLLGTMHCTRYWGCKDENMGSLLSRGSQSKGKLMKKTLSFVHCRQGLRVKQSGLRSVCGAWKTCWSWKCWNWAEAAKWQSLAVFDLLSMCTQIAGKPIKMMEETDAVVYPNIAMREKM